jgi:hypothetical protein
MRVVIVSFLLGMLVFGLNFLEKEEHRSAPPQNIDGIDVKICGYITRDGYECIESGPKLPQGRVWIRLLSDKPILKESVTARLYVIIDGKRNQIAEQAFLVDDPYRFRAYVDLNRMGDFVITVSDPEIGFLGEAYANIFPIDPNLIQ